MRGIGAVVVVDQHVAGGSRGPAHHVPGVDHQVGALAEEGAVGQAAGGDDDEVGLLGEHVGRLGEHPEAEVDAEALGLGDPPVDDAEEVRRRGEAAASRTWPPGA